MRYSVLILTHGDRLRALQRCVDKVFTSARTLGDDYEMIVVNNGAQENTRDWLDNVQRRTFSNKVTIINREENEGVCARNYGIEVAKGDAIIQVDDDVLVTPGFDEVLLAPYADSKVGATGPHGFYQDQGWAKLIDDRRRPRPGQYADLLMGYCWSWRNIPFWECNCGWRGRPFDMSPNPSGGLCCPSCGGSGGLVSARFRYDWDFSPFWHEESDLQMQMRAAGYRLAVTPQVATHQTLHNWGETKADGPVTGLTIAKRNFFQLVDKWADKGIAMEGPAVGLTGPAPGRASNRSRDDFAGKAVT